MEGGTGVPLSIMKGGVGVIVIHLKRKRKKGFLRNVNEVTGGKKRERVKPKKERGGNVSAKQEKGCSSICTKIPD